jgi:subtilisin-like proprotein convertase family protein
MKNMKIQAAILSLLVLTSASQAALQFSQSVNQLIPDGSPSGLASTISITGQGVTISDLTVTLDVNGSYNGDLYAYLRHGNSIAVLLNRVGATPADISGYGDPGMNVTFSDSAANGNIHTYRQTLFGNPNQGLNGPLTGTWAPDGRAVSPYSVTGTETPTALLSAFDGQTVNGSWTLFVADVSGGDLNYLTSWGLQIDTIGFVPESKWYGVLAMGLVLSLAIRRSFRFGQP